jgi:CRP-like cAMP-binding protein
VVADLVRYFVSTEVPAGTVLWSQGSAADRAIILVRGRLRSRLEDEAGTIEEIYPGHLIGEYGLISNDLRRGTVEAAESSTVLILTAAAFAQMRAEDANLAFVLSKICMQYLMKRTMHVSNRIWESRCLPV